MFSYRALLKQAWDITWKHKYLWFLGLFTALVASGGSWEYQVISNNFNQSLVDGSYYRLNDFLTASDLLKNFGQGLLSLFHYDFWTILNVLSLLILAAAFAIFLIWLAVTSQAALIGDVKKIQNSKKKDLPLSLRDSLTSGHQHFWSVLGLDLIIKILIAAAFFIISLPLLFIAIKDTTALMIIYTILFVIFVPVSVSLSLMTNYVIAYRVLDNKSLVSSLEHGYRLFKNNWLVSLETGVILFILSFLASGVLLAVLGIFLLPLVLLGILLSLTWLTVIALFLAIALVIIFGAALTTFQVTTWTGLFLQLKDKGALAKLERLFGRGR
jgi:hypothetical protein